MNAYQVNKTVGLGVPVLVLLLGLALFAPNDISLWWWLIVFTHTLGLMHFILGYVYQQRAITRQQNQRKLFTLYFLTLLAVAFALVFIVTGNIALLAVIAVGYFVLHGTLNEHSMMEKQLGYAPSISYIAPFVLYITPFFLLSLTHPSFFFNATLDFYNPGPAEAVRLLNETISLDVLWFLSLLMHGLFIYLVPLRLLRERMYLPATITLVLVLTALWVFYAAQPLNYVFLYAIALSYHFVSWSVYYWQVFRQHAPTRIPSYLWHHLIILLPLISISVLVASGVPGFEGAHNALFDGRIFLILAMVHNTTSFINDRWFADWLKLDAVEYKTS